MTEGHGADNVDPLLSGAQLRRRPRHARSVIKEPRKPARVVVAVLFLSALILGGLYYRTLLYGQYAVTIDGVPITALATREQGEEAIRLLKQQYAIDVPEVVHFEEGELVVEPLKHKMPVSNVAEAVKRLQEHVTPHLKGWAIYINGRPVVMLATKVDAEKTISLILEQASADTGGIPTFKERVRLASYEQTPRPDRSLIPVLTPGRAARELTHPPRQQYAIVKRGGSFYAIASEHRLTVKRIKELNPNLNPGALQPGDQVRLPDVTAPLTVIIRQERVDE